MLHIYIPFQGISYPAIMLLECVYMIPSLLLIVFILWGVRLFKIHIVIFGMLLGLALGAIFGYYIVKITGLPLENQNTLSTIVTVAGGIVGVGLVFPFKKIFARINAGIYLGILGSIVSMLLILPHTVTFVFIILFLIGFFIAFRFYNYAVIVIMVITGLGITVFLLQLQLHSIVNNIHFLFRLKNYFMSNPISSLQFILLPNKQYITYTIVLLLGSSIYSILLQKHYAHTASDPIHITHKKTLFRNICYFFTVILLIGSIFEILFYIISFYNVSLSESIVNSTKHSIYRLIQMIFKNTQNMTGVISPHIVGMGIIHFPFVAMLLYLLLPSYKSPKTSVPIVYSNTLVRILYSIACSIILIPFTYFVIQTIVTIPSAFTVPYTELAYTISNYFIRTVKNSTLFFTFFFRTPYNTSISTFIITSKWIFSFIIFPVLLYLLVFKREKAFAYSSKLNLSKPQNKQEQNTTNSVPPSYKTTHTTASQQHTHPPSITNVPNTIQKNTSKTSNDPTSKKRNNIDYVTLLIQKKYTQQKHLLQLITETFYKIQKVQKVIPNTYGIRGAHLFLQFKEGLSISHLQTKGVLAVQVLSYNATTQERKNIPLIKEAMQRSKASMGMVIITANYSYKDIITIKKEIQTIEETLQKPIVLVAGRNVARFVLTFGGAFFLSN